MTDGVLREVRQVGDAVVAVAAGEITLDRSPEFHHALLDLCDRRPRRLVIELSQVTHIDSAGVGTLVDVFRRTRAAKCAMSLVGLTPRVRNVFEITKLDHFFTIYANEEEALAS